jgi:hypothetical protein
MRKIGIGEHRDIAELNQVAHGAEPSNLQGSIVADTTRLNRRFAPCVSKHFTFSNGKATATPEYTQCKEQPAERFA